MTQEEINKFPSKASARDKLSAIVEHYREKGYEVENTGRRFGDEIKIINPENRVKISCYRDVSGRFTINYSGNKCKILKTIIKKIDDELLHQEKITKNTKSADILLDDFILALNYSGLDKKYTKEDFSIPSLYNIHKIIEYKGVSIMVKINENFTPSFSLSVMNANDAIIAAEYINVFKEKWELTQL